MKMIFLFFLFLKSYSALKIHVNRESFPCRDDDSCDGNFERPFGSLNAAFENIHSMKERIEKDMILQIILENNRVETPYLILGFEGITADYFSPFSILSENIMIEICGGACETISENRAFVSLRTDQLILEIKSRLLLLNLEIDGANLPVVRTNKECLLSLVGCCGDKDFSDKNSECYIRFKRISKESILSAYDLPYKIFSLLTTESQAVQQALSANQKLELKNILFNKMNPVSKYAALVGVVPKANFSLLCENVEISKSVYLFAPITVLKESNENIKIEIINLNALSYNYFKLDIGEEYVHSLMILLGHSTLSFSGLFVQNAVFPGYLVKGNNISSLRLTDSLIKNVSSGVYRFKNCNSITIISLKIEANVAIENEMNKNIYLLDIQGTFDFVLAQSSFADFNSRRFGGIVSLEGADSVRFDEISFEKIDLNGALLKTAEINILKIKMSVFSQLESMTGGVMNFLSSVDNVFLEQNIYSYISGKKGTIVFQSSHARVKFLSIKNCTFSDITSSNENLFEFIPTDYIVVFFEEINFLRVKSGNNIIFFASEADSSTINQPPSILCILTKIYISGSSACIIMADNSNTLIFFNNFLITNSNSKSRILIKSFSVKNIILQNVHASNCSSFKGLAEVDGDHQEKATLILKNCTFDTIKGEAKFLCYVLNLFVFGSKFSANESPSGTYCFPMFLSNVFINQSIFQRFRILIYTLINLLTPGWFYHFKHSLFREIITDNVGASVMCDGKHSNLLIEKCEFYDFRGSAGAVLGIVAEAFLFVNGSYFRKFFMRQKGSIILVAKDGQALIENSKFSDAVTSFNGAALVLYFAKAKVTNCVFLELEAYRGGVFFIFDKSALSVEKSLFLNCKSHMDGGVISANNFISVAFFACSFESLHSNTFGGIFSLIYRRKGNNKHFFQADSCIINSVQSNLDGGVGYFLGVRLISLTNINISSSRALNGGAFLFQVLDKVVVENITAFSPWSVEKGAVFFIESCASIQIFNSTFKNIRDVLSGGISYISNSKVIFSKVSLVNISESNNLFYLYCNQYLELTLSSALLSNSTLSGTVIQIMNDQSSLENIRIIMTELLVKDLKFYNFIVGENFFTSMEHASFESNFLSSSQQSVIFKFKRGVVFIKNISIANTFGIVLLEANMTISLQIEFFSFSRGSEFKTIFSAIKTRLFILRNASIIFGNNDITSILLKNVGQFELRGFDFLSLSTAADTRILISEFSNTTLAEGKILGFASGSGLLLRTLYSTGNHLKIHDIGIELAFLQRATWEIVLKNSSEQS